MQLVHLQLEIQESQVLVMHGWVKVCQTGWTSIDAAGNSKEEYLRASLQKSAADWEGQSPAQGSVNLSTAPD